MDQPNSLSCSLRTQGSRHVATRPRNPVGDLLYREDVILDLDAHSKNQAFDAIADFLERSHGLDAEQVRMGLIEREALGSTALGRGVAIPHARVQGLQRAVAVFARFGTPIAFDAPDRKPVSDMFILLVPDQATDEHLKILALVAEMFCDTSFRETLRSLADPGDVHLLFATWRPS
jgi:nitrogen PTS system EIIA component